MVKQVKQGLPTRVCVAREARQKIMKKKILQKSQYF